MPDIIPGELKDLEIEEISIVDKPAIGRKFVIMKRGGDMAEQEKPEDQEVEKLNSEPKEPEEPEVKKVEDQVQEEQVEKVEEQEEPVEKQEESEEEVGKSDTSNPVAEQLASIEERLEALDERVAKILDAIEDVRVVGKRLARRKAAVYKAEEEDVQEKPRTVEELRKSLRKTLEVQFGISD